MSILFIGINFGNRLVVLILASIQYVNRNVHCLEIETKFSVSSNRSRMPIMICLMQCGIYP